MSYHLPHSDQLEDAPLSPLNYGEVIVRQLHTVLAIMHLLQNLKRKEKKNYIVCCQYQNFILNRIILKIFQNFQMMVGFQDQIGQRAAVKLDLTSKLATETRRHFLHPLLVGPTGFIRKHFCVGYICSNICCNIYSLIALKLNKPLFFRHNYNLI